MGAYNQSYLGMPTPQAVGQAQNAAQTGTSSVPGGGVTPGGGGPKPGAAASTQDLSGGNAYLQGLNYGATQSQPQANQGYASGLPGNYSINPYGSIVNQSGQTIFDPASFAGMNSGTAPQIPNGFGGFLTWNGSAWQPQGVSAGASNSTMQALANGGPLSQSATPAYTGTGSTPTANYQAPNVPGANLHVMGGSGGQYWQDQNTGAVYDAQGTKVYDPGLGPGGIGPTNPVGNYPYSGTGGYTLPGGGFTGNPGGGSPTGGNPGGNNPGGGNSGGGGAGGTGGVQSGSSGLQVGGGGPGASLPGQPPLTPTGGTGGQPAPSGNGAFPNTYGGGFQNYPQQTYTPNPFVGNTPPATMFSGNEGPQAGAAGRPPSGYGVVPPYSPAMSQMYFQYLLNQIGQGASPYGQQNTFLPSQGASGMAGLSAPMSPFAQYAQNALTSNIGNIGNLLDPNNLQAMMGAYGGLQNVGNTFAQQGGYGYPGSQLGLQAQYGARGNPGDPNGLYTGAQALQGAASGQGLPGLPGQYLNSAMQYGGMGLPANVQSAFAQFGAGPGAGGNTLSNMAQFGNPIDQTQAWQNMVAAQQRNIAQNQAQVARQAAVGGGLLGTPYQTALADFQNQAALNQNALLGQMTAQAQENAAQRMLGAAGTMSGQQLGAAQNLGALQQQAGLFGAGNQLANSQYLQNLMSGGLGQMNQNQLYGLGQTGSLIGQSQQIPNQIYQGYLGQMGNQIGNALNLGQQYQNLDQNAINRQYQEFLRTQPEYSPLLQQLFAGATTFPGIVSTQFGSGGVPTAIGQLLGGLGGGQGISSLLGSFGGSGSGGAGPFAGTGGYGTGYPGPFYGGG